MRKNPLYVDKPNILAPTVEVSQGRMPQLVKAQGGVEPCLVEPELEQTAHVALGHPAATAADEQRCLGLQARVSHGQVVAQLAELTNQVTGHHHLLAAGTFLAAPFEDAQPPAATHGPL